MAETEILSEFKLGNRPELDGIRALAVLAVIAWHIGIPYVRAGNIGVDVFFVLSGFLITTLILQEWTRKGSINLKNFYARRALRLFPVLFFVMLLYALYSYFYESPIQSANSFLYISAALFYVANWAQIVFGIHHSVLGHTWSLAVEEQFYILYPLLLIAFLRLKISHAWLVGGFLTIFAAVTLNRYWIWQDKFSYDRAHMSLDTRADALLIGCFVSVLIVNRIVPTHAWLVVLVRILSVCATGVLGLVIVGGVIFSLVLTLFVIPAMYTYLSRVRKHNPLDEAITVPLQKPELAYEA